MDGTAGRSLRAKSGTLSGAADGKLPSSSGGGNVINVTAMAGTLRPAARGAFEIEGVSWPVAQAPPQLQRQQQQPQHAGWLSRLFPSRYPSPTVCGFPACYGLAREGFNHRLLGKRCGVTAPPQ